MFNLNSTGRQKREFPVETTGANEQAAAMQNPVGKENMEVDAQMERRFNEIDAQRVAFEAKNPGFDIKTEMANTDFVNYVWGNNLTVEEAYYLVHKDEILEQVRADAVKEFAARSNRIPENGAAKNRPAMTTKNPKDLTDKEIDSIIERVRNGEKITF